MSTQHDPGLRVVARVRGVRERDSRLGMAEALIEERAAAARVDHLQQQLVGGSTDRSGDLASFTARQQHLDLLAGALATARGDRDSAGLVALAAREQWHTYRTQLAAVESLLERRAAARRAEAQRREQRELDAVGEQLWLRRRGLEAHA